MKVQLIFTNKAVTVLPVLDGLISYCRIIASVLFLIQGKMLFDDQYWENRTAS